MTKVVFCFPLRSVHNAAIVSVGFLEKLCHNKWNLFSFMRFTCIFSRFLVKTAAVRSCAVCIIYWQYTLIFLVCSVTKFQNAACVLQTKAKSAVCQMYLDVMLILNKSSLLNPYFTYFTLPQSVSHNA